MLSRPRGTVDVLPEEAAAWQWLEGVAARASARAGFGEIRTPMFELAEVFDRSSGETSDIVEKEMYRFRDRSDRELALRPEFTAAVVRALLEAGRIGPQMAPLRLWYLGPLFRYDRPQAGRQRQYVSFGAEVVGAASPVADAEALLLAVDFLESAGAAPFEVRLNSIGDEVCRPEYRKALVAYATPFRDRLCAQCRRRLEVNPLRLLDCKVPADQAVLAQAPRPREYLCRPCADHDARLRDLLAAAGQPVVDDPRLVRGLDYYTRTVFEVVDPALGAEGVMAGGGRYDGLVALLGGPPTPAVGFGLGMERVLLRLAPRGLPGPARPDCAVVVADASAAGAALALARDLRRQGLSATLELADRSLKAQLRAADRDGARFALVLGAREVEEHCVTVRRLVDGSQSTVPRDRVMEALGRTQAGQEVGHGI